MNDPLVWASLAFIAMGIGCAIGCILLRDDPSKFALKQNNKILSAILATNLYENNEIIELSKDDVVLLRAICQCYYKNIPFKHLPQIILNLQATIDGKLNKS